VRGREDRQPIFRSRRRPDTVAARDETLGQRQPEPAASQYADGFYAFTSHIFETR
jgi:hypothetical protein